MIEFNDWEKWGTTLNDDIAVVHQLGLRTFAATKSDRFLATVNNHLDILHTFDVVYTYNLGNAVKARQQVNTERGLTPA